MPLALTADDRNLCMTLRTLNYGNYGIFLIMGNAGFIPSTVVLSLDGETRAPSLIALAMLCAHAPSDFANPKMEQYLLTLKGLINSRLLGPKTQNPKPPKTSKTP